MVTFNGKNIADMGFYINLAHRTDRKKKLEYQLDKFNIRGVERFNAINDTETAPLNCKKSHFELYKKLIEYDQETLLVLEDDCLFLDFLSEEYDKIFTNINNTDWDIFWLGCRNRRKPLFYKNNCYLVSSVSHAQSYLIKKNFAKYLVEKYPIQDTCLYPDELLSLAIYGEDVTKNPNLFNFYNLIQPLDVLQPIYKALTYEKCLTTQYPSYSDLRQFEVDYEKYISTTHPTE